MKRTERHHLKENELEKIALQARETVEARRREIISDVTVLIVVGAAAIGYFLWHDRTESKAHALLADALAVQEVRVGPPAAQGTPNPTASFPTERDRAQAALAK